MTLTRNLNIIIPRLLLIVVLFISALQSAQAQQWKVRRYEIFGGVSANSLFGDLGGYPTGQNLFGLKDIQIGGLRPGVQLGMRYKISSKVWLKGYLSYNQYATSDKGSHNDARGFASTSVGYGTGLQVEYAFITEDRRKGRIVFDRKGLLSSSGTMAAYVFSGVKGMYFKPVLTAPIVVSPNETITTYSFAFVLPIGIGYKFFISRKTSIGFEFSANFTTTDLLDGYTSSFSKSNDFYYQLNACVAYKIYTKRNGSPSFNRR